MPRRHHGSARAGPDTIGRRHEVAGPAPRRGPRSPATFHRLTNIYRRTYLSGVTSQEQRRAETRGRLLDAAAELFVERGVEGASIDAIAERADRTSGAVYAHFGGKDGVLFAL